MIDLGWIYAIVEASAAFVAIVGAFFTTKILSIASEKRAVSNRVEMLTKEINQRNELVDAYQEEIDSLIASCGNKTAAFLQTFKETGMRSGEAFSLEWSDIDTERHLINLKRPEKGSYPRIFKVSVKLVDMLKQLPKKSKRVFGNSLLGSLRSNFCASTKKATKKLANPRLTQIHFHTLRHWKATMEYHKTKDPYHVKQLLGHKSLRNTEVYINLEQAIFNEGDNSEYTSRIAKTVKGARALLEAGFEYVTDMNGFKLFRKRK